MNVKKMNPEVKTLWVEALRSGEYQQGKLLLKPTKNTFCCLGVLCDLAVKANVENISWGESEEHNGHGIYHDNNYDECRGFDDSELPFSIVNWAGTNSENPKVEVPDKDWHSFTEDDPPTKLVTLAELNDEHNYSFKQIADLIEAQL